jgi:hypothetical protein
MTRASYCANVCRNGHVCDRFSSIKRRICGVCDNEKFYFDFNRDNKVCIDCERKMEHQRNLDNAFRTFNTPSSSNNPCVNGCRCE